MRFRQVIVPLSIACLMGVVSAPGGASAQDRAVQSQLANAEAAPAGTSAEAPIGADVRKKLLEPSAPIGEDEAADWQALLAEYEERKDEPLWVSKSGLNLRGQAVVAELANAGDWGLEASNFKVPDIAAESNGADIARDKLVNAELQLSLSVLKYARHARGGRIPDPAKQLSSYLDRLPQYKDPKVVLDTLVASSDPTDVLRELHPRHPQFDKLRRHYLEVRNAKRESEEAVRLPKGPKLIPGEKQEQVALLRKRMGQDAESIVDPSMYDEALADAVKAFQEKKGLKPDGIVGRTTRDALNDIEMPSPERLLANMEQWRWMPDDLGETYVWVNIPEFMVRVVKNNVVIFEERVVTGEASKQTPVFSDLMETIYFHPRWNVPEGIKILELYPSLARGGGGFQRQGLKLMRNGRYVDPYSVDWSRSDIRNYDVYQPSGPSNVLGLVKFVFPNKHGVYMHDTTAKSLFNEASRPFSHGCMRVRNPLRMAEVLLAADQGWDAARIENIIQSEPDETAVTLQHKIPVHVTYFTSVIGADGTEQTFKDVYGHEQRIKLALAGKWTEIARGPDHLAPVKFQRAQYARSPEDWGSFFGGPGQQGKKRYSNSNSAFNDFMNNLFGGF